MKSSLLVFAAHSAEGSASIPPIVLGIIVFTIAVAALLAVIGFRNVGTRYRNR